MEQMQYISIKNFKTEAGSVFNVKLSYQIFGKALHEAPIVLINHALTGNSNVCGPNGWWNTLIGLDKCIDTRYYTILAFNVPGNGSPHAEFEEPFDYKAISARDIARIFGLGLNHLRIDTLFAIIGGSVGGGIAWELAALYPRLASHLIPIATDWKSTDWVIANCHVQDRILNNSINPVSDARLHAMTLYRTPESFRSKFNRSKHQIGLFNIESWLNHHGEKLRARFQLKAYRIMNQILKTIDITQNRNSFIEVASKITATIHMITISSDLLFKPEQNWSSYVDLKCCKENVYIQEIKSIHGHDAFLIEFDQLQRFLKPIFSSPTMYDMPERRNLKSTMSQNLHTNSVRFS